MAIDLPKPGGFSSLTSTSPKSDSIPLGTVLRGLSDRLSVEASETINETLDLYLDEHARYANAQQIIALSSPRALKAWAAERLPSLGISYGFSSRIDFSELKDHLDEQASLRLVEFADDVTLIADYCRTVEQLEIEAAPHSHGLEFRFIFSGTRVGQDRAKIEEESISSLLDGGSRDNSLRRRVTATDQQLEAECIALRKKVRLGISPLF